MAKVASDNMIRLCFSFAKRRLPKVERHALRGAAMNAMRKVVLNIRYGNTAPIVVRDGRAVHMAKGGSLTLNTLIGKVRDAL